MKNHSKTTRYLILRTFRGRREAHGKMHLAKVQTTKQPVTTAWCGRTLYPNTPPQYVSGEDAFFSYLGGLAENNPVCARCLDTVGAWDWYA